MLGYGTEKESKGGPYFKDAAFGGVAQDVKTDEDDVVGEACEVAVDLIAVYYIAIRLCVCLGVPMNMFCQEGSLEGVQLLTAAKQGREFLTFFLKGFDCGGLVRMASLEMGKRCKILLTLLLDGDLLDELLYFLLCLGILDG